MSNKKGAVVLSCFPCSGKTYCKNHTYSLKIKDSDSSIYHWERDSFGNKIKDKNGDPIVNRNWPDNYIDAIKADMDEYDVIFVSSHQEIRDALRDAGIKFTTVYPDPDLKEECIDRAINRRNNGFPIEVLDKNWDKWIAQCKAEPGEKIELKSGYYAMDVVRSVQPGRVYDNLGSKICVITVATNVKNGTKLVIYESLETESTETFAIPVSDFLAHVDRKKYPEAQSEYMFTETQMMI